ncbi:MAG: hypothetical protein Ct9H300mP1_29950 [Planctomycetaceae bacterium]|nr:MAG: hypothetical protein Ct9H300mP1_29950 [Planctomycetaceae bacterium]
MTDFSNTGWISADTFAGLPPDAMSLLETCLQEKHFQQGEHLIPQGDIGEEMFVITSGHALVMTEDKEGQRHVIARTGPGDVLGEMALLAREPRTADAIAQEPLVARVLPAETFHTLIESYPEFSQFLTRLVATRVGGADRDVLVGRDMDGFRIARRLGRGGMAVVYEAVGPDHQKVALKMMSHRLVCDERSRAAFQREADIIETFDHPHIVKMLGRFAMFYTFFIVVEHIDGKSLHELIHDGGPLPAASVRKILGQLVQGLGYAHDSEIIHRDIKPGNVMITRDGQIKLMDFGLAKPTNANSADDRVLVGTPGYMSPELLTGGEPSPASDLFAMGCLAVELLDGDRLFGQTTVNAFMAAVKCWEGWSPSNLELRIDDELADVIASWLAPVPSDRKANFERIAGWAGPVEWPKEIEICDPPDLDDSEVTRAFDDSEDTETGE